MVRLGKSKKTAAPEARRRPVPSGSVGNFSYYSSKRSNLPSRNPVEARHAKPATKRFPKLRLNKLHIGQQFGTVLLVIALVASVISVLQIDTTARIVILNSASQQGLHTTHDYQQSVTSSLRGSLLNSNKITVNTRAVVTDLRQKFPEIYDASMVLPLVGHRPTVYIELTKPAVVLQTASMAAVVDSSGRALTTSPDASSYSAIGLPIVHDESQLTLKAGDVALPSSNVAFIRDIVRQFTAQHIGVSKMVLPAATEELDVFVQGAPYYVKFNLHDTNTSREQAGTFFAVKEQLAHQAQQGTTPKEYVDVRLVGRAYYK